MKKYRPVKSAVALPAELVGKWAIGHREYDFRDNGEYRVLDAGIPYSLVDGGSILIHAGTRYRRLYGAVTGVVGVWTLEVEPTEEWNLRSDGTYTYHSSDSETYGDYSFDATTMSTSEMRAVLSESNGVLTFDPPYAPTESGVWTLVEPELTIALPSGDLRYTRA